MQILPEFEGFDWDRGNLEKNLKKHSVTSQEAEELFASDPFVARRDDYRSNEIEERLQALGKTKTGRKLFIAFTLRNNKIRVISVRDMTPQEERAYEKLEEHS
ncbi:MAG TPA: BrnT family toxin [Candidatus Saccharimonadia bacterium]|nr:BrnT family toxin [Candidatus Saccharimonadia bacterium]